MISGRSGLGPFAYRMKVKAGLAGFAQVYGKYNTSPYDKLKLDLTYIENYSVMLDVKLMLLTGPAPRPGKASTADRCSSSCRSHRHSSCLPHCPPRIPLETEQITALREERRKRQEGRDEKEEE